MPKQNICKRRCVWLCVLCAQMSCSRQAPRQEVSLAHAMRSVKPDLLSQLPKPVQEDATQRYTYAAVGKRDPFASYVDTLKQAGRVRSVKPLAPTQRYDLGQFRLTGVVTGTSQPRALVSDPAGRGHILHVGDKLGRNGGTVVRISQRGLTVMERLVDGSGDIKRVPIKLLMPKIKAADLGSKNSDEQDGLQPVSAPAASPAGLSRRAVVPLPGIRSAP